MSKNSASITEFQGFSKPVCKLLECLRAGMGVLYEPRRVVALAKANAKAKLIEAEADVQKQELFGRSRQRSEFLDQRRQRNLDGIVAQALTMLPPEVSGEPVDEDWIVHFSEQCQDTGNRLIQNLWARLLAGEVAVPGSYSLRTIGVIKTLTPDEATVFSKYCNYVFKDESGKHRRLCQQVADGYLEGIGLGKAIREDLDELGLIKTGFRGFGVDKEQPNCCVCIGYADRNVRLAKNYGRSGCYPFHLIEPLTVIGEQLYALLEIAPDMDYFDIVVNSFLGHRGQSSD